MEWEEVKSLKEWRDGDATRRQNISAEYFNVFIKPDLPRGYDEEKARVLWAREVFDDIAPFRPVTVPNATLRGLAMIRRDDLTRSIKPREAVDELFVPKGVLERLEMVRERDPGLRGVAWNVMVGGTSVLASTPSFLAQLTVDPVGVAKEMGKWGIETTIDVWNSLNYIGFEATGMMDEVPQKLRNELRASWKRIREHPESPIMLYFAGKGAIVAPGKTKAVGRQIMDDIKAGRVKPDDIDVARYKPLIQPSETAPAPAFAQAPERPVPLPPYSTGSPQAPLDVVSPTPTSRRLEQVPPVDRTGRPIEIDILPERKPSSTEIKQEEISRETARRLTVEEPEPPFTLPQVIRPTELNRPPIPSEGRLQQGEIPSGTPQSTLRSPSFDDVLNELGADKLGRPQETVGKRISDEGSLSKRQGGIDVLDVSDLNATGLIPNTPPVAKTATTPAPVAKEGGKLQGSPVVLAYESLIGKIKGKYPPGTATPKSLTLDDVFKEAQSLGLVKNRAEFNKTVTDFYETDIGKQSLTRGTNASIRGSGGVPDAVNTIKITDSAAPSPKAVAPPVAKPATTAAPVAKDGAKSQTFRSDEGFLEIPDPKVIAEKVRQLDANVLAAIRGVSQLPQGVSDGTIRRVAQRNNIDPDVAVAKLREGAYIPATESTPKPKSDKYTDPDTFIKDQRKAVDESRHKSSQDRIRQFKRNWIDTAANVKNALNSIGDKGSNVRALGEDAVMKYTLTKGWSSEAVRQFNGYWNKIERELVGSVWSSDFGSSVGRMFHLAENERRLGEYLAANRVIELTERSNINKKMRDDAQELFDSGEITEEMRDAILSEFSWGEGKERKNPGGLTDSDWRDKYINTRDREWGVDIHNRINGASSLFYEAMRHNLEQMLGAGLISQKGYNTLVSFSRYSPFKYLQHIDDARGGIELGVRPTSRSVKESGIKSLKEGSEGYLDTNPSTLLFQSIAKVQSRIFNNDAALALRDVAIRVPGNGIVEPAGVKWIGEGEARHSVPAKIPSDKVQVSAIQDGVRYDMWMPEELGREWLNLDRDISQNVADWVGWASGTNILKAMATGYNPEFSIANLPRDIAYVWQNVAGTSQFGKKLYTSFAPGYLGQLSVDMLTVLPDVLLRRGRYVDSIREGIGMDFITTQGRLSGIERKGGDIAKGLGDALSYTNTTFEILTRLAVRERAIKSGLSPQQATFVARNYLDFSQGGSMSKAFDKGVPYLNAAIQATRNTVNAARANPGLTTWKVSQIGGITLGLYYANRRVNQEAWDDISDEMKKNNWIVTLPYPARIDEKGQRHYMYVKIAKDQGQRLISGLFQAIAEREEEGRVPYDKLFRSFVDASAVPGISSLPPTLLAALGYAGNKDWWLNRDIWGGAAVEPSAEIKPSTKTEYIRVSEGARELGIQVSPSRLQYAVEKFLTSNNIYEDLVGLGAKKLFANLDDKAVSQVRDDMFRQIPGLRRVIAETSPDQKERESLKRLVVKENTARLKNNQEVIRLVNAGESGKARVFAKGQADQNERERLERRIEIIERNKTLPDFWINLAEQSPSVRATYFWQEWVKADETQKKELWKMATSIQGFRSADFNRYFHNLLRLKGQETNK